LGELAFDGIEQLWQSLFDGIRKAVTLLAR